MSTSPAYRADGRDVSREAFYALACDPRRSVVVEACAGAGKTWMLVSRIVRALQQTFTTMSSTSCTHTSRSPAATVQLSRSSARDHIRSQ